MEFIKNHLFDLIGWLIGVLGVVATLLVFWFTEENIFKIVFSAILAFEFVLVIIGVWNIIIKYQFEGENNTLNKEIQELNIKLNDLETKLKNDTIKNNLSIIVSNLKNASKLHNEFCNRIPEISEESYHLLETLSKADEIEQETKKDEIMRSYKTFANGLFDLYKRYSTGLLKCAINSTESFLNIKGYTYNVSATIKLLNKPWCPKNNGRSKVRVYSAFRDERTYESHSREIGQELYTIDGNVDFSVCVTKEQFIINNATKDSDNYLNEHVDFDSYYNCTVVVPIRVKLVDNSYKILGFLCCDCLNKDLNVEVFDKEIAHFLFSLAQIYSIFLETLESNWIDRRPQNVGCPESFLEVIYAQTYVGKKQI